MKPTGYPEYPHEIWEHFFHLTQIPRPSKKEQLVCEYILRLADEHGMKTRRDSAGNIVVLVPGTHGMEKSEPVIIQNHVDMVTVKTGDSTHDFEKDPLTLIVRNGWLSADCTTLGADNGLGCAAALALITDKSVVHPPLELLFTMDEETGLNGASDLDPTLMTGKRMLNLDTEDWQELYVGCAGGKGWQFNRQLDVEHAPEQHVALQVEIKGLAGGHSGVQIHQQLANANKLMAYWLKAASEMGARIAGYHGGVAHNVIAREARMDIYLPDSAVGKLQALNESLLSQWKTWLEAADVNIELKMQALEHNNGQVLTSEAQKQMLHWMMLFPHGAQTYNETQPADLVDLSINLAVVSLKNGELFTEASCRFFNEAEASNLVDQVMALSETLGMTPESILDYPGWNPDFDSPLLKKASDLHQELFDIKPKVKAIHAGLECGILKSKKQDLDILSFGPNIRGAHSPSERLEIATVEPFWQFLVAMLRHL